MVDHGGIDYYNECATGASTDKFEKAVEKRAIAADDGSENLLLKTYLCVWHHIKQHTLTTNRLIR